MIILVWHGAGILVVVFWLVAIFTGDRLAEALFGPNASASVHNLTVQWLAAALTFLLALFVRLDKSVAMDPRTGELIVTRGRHSFFWIPVIAWAGIFFVLGIVVYFKSQPPTPSPALFELTPAAVEKIGKEATLKSLKKDWYLSVEPYCVKNVDSPLYSFKIVTGLNHSRDYYFESNGIKILVLKRHVEIMRGAQVDIEIQAGVEVYRVKNPNLEGDKLKKWRRELEKV